MKLTLAGELHFQLKAMQIQKTHTSNQRHTQHIQQLALATFTPKEPKREEAQVPEPMQAPGEQANPTQKGQS